MPGHAQDVSRVQELVHDSGARGSIARRDEARDAGTDGDGRMLDQRKILAVVSGEVEIVGTCSAGLEGAGGHLCGGEHQDLAGRLRDAIDDEMPAGRRRRVVEHDVDQRVVVGVARFV